MVLDCVGVFKREAINSILAGKIEKKTMENLSGFQNVCRQENTVWVWGQ